MSADPQHRPTPQDQILAWEMAAFPVEDEPDWEALEYLEYFGDGEPDDHRATNRGIAAATPGDHHATSPGTPGATPGDHHASSSGTAAATPAAARADGGDTAADAVAAGVGFAQGGVADVMPPGPVLAGLADRAWQDGLGRLDDDELIGVLAAWQRLGAWAAAGLFAAASELAARREAEGRATRGRADAGARRR